MESIQSQQSGFLVIKVVLLVAAMIFGYIVISNVIESDEGKEAVETVNSAKEQADKVLR